MPWKHGVQAYPSLVWKLWNLSLFRTDVVEQKSHPWKPSQTHPFQVIQQF